MRRDIQAKIPARPLKSTGPCEAVPSKFRRHNIRFSLWWGWSLYFTCYFRIAIINSLTEIDAKSLIPRSYLLVIWLVAMGFLLHSVVTNTSNCMTDLDAGEAILRWFGLRWQNTLDIAKTLFRASFFSFIQLMHTLSTELRLLSVTVGLT